MITVDNAWIILMVATLCAVFGPIIVMAWHLNHEDKP